jgi:hypothetical protein
MRHQPQSWPHAAGVQCCHSTRVQRVLLPQRIVRRRCIPRVTALPFIAWRNSAVTGLPTCVCGSQQLPARRVVVVLVQRPRPAFVGDCCARSSNQGGRAVLVHATRSSVCGRLSSGSNQRKGRCACWWRRQGPARCRNTHHCPRADSFLIHDKGWGLLPLHSQPAGGPWHMPPTRLRVLCVRGGSAGDAVHPRCCSKCVRACAWGFTRRPEKGR